MFKKPKYAIATLKLRAQSFKNMPRKLVHVIAMMELQGESFKNISIQLE
jgi:hypothetical protein